ncbi:MAG: hypothetical protein ACREM3_05785 [Candidatus Rokuibacteriota bacterium]
MRDDIARAVCEMAIIFKSRDDVSMLDLLLESGYLREPDGIDESAIERQLRRNPELVDSWVDHSEDRRSSPAWYVARPEAAGGAWPVGYVSTSGSRSEKRSFTDGFAACAFYIKREVEGLRALGQKG